MARPLPLAALAALLIAGCSASRILVVVPDGTRVEPLQLDEWLAVHALAPGQEIGIHELGRTTGTSLHLVQIRTKERPHVHQRHDAAVLIKRGHGTLFLGSHQLRLTPGSIVNIPRGVPHAFVNDARQPAVAFVVFSPPFDGTDVVPVP